MDIRISNYEDSTKFSDMVGTVSNFVTKKMSFTYKRTIGGKVKHSHTGYFDTLSLNIVFINSRNRQELDNIFIQSNSILVELENGESYVGYFSDESLTYTPQKDNRGNEFYSISMNIEM